MANLWKSVKRLSVVGGLVVAVLGVQTWICANLGIWCFNPPTLVAKGNQIVPGIQTTDPATELQIAEEIAEARAHEPRLEPGGPSGGPIDQVIPVPGAPAAASAPADPIVDAAPDGGAVTPVVQPLIVHPRWLSAPSPSVIRQKFPEEARGLGAPGVATLLCDVLMGGSLACAVAAEDPVGLGFGQAALAVARLYRMDPELEDGSASAGRRVQFEIRFSVGDDGASIDAQAWFCGPLLPDTIWTY